MTLFVSFCSGGNDSLAVLQILVEYELPKKHSVVAVYSDTGWASPEWPERMNRVEAWCIERSIQYHVIPSKGFERLVREEGNRKGEPPGRFPSGLQKFCTRQLKIFPAQDWLDSIDPSRLAVCVVGVRRAESARRSNAPVFTPSSIHHGGRSLWHPLAETSNLERDAILRRGGWEPLPHRSDECQPCIFATRADLRRVTPNRVDLIRRIEQDTGKTMFRPAAYAGAQGIDEIIRWAHSDKGQYRPGDADTERLIQEDGQEDCESGFCGL